MGNVIRPRKLPSAQKARGSWVLPGLPFAKNATQRKVLRFPSQPKKPEKDPEGTKTTDDELNRLLAEVAEGRKSEWGSTRRSVLLGAYHHSMSIAPYTVSAPIACANHSIHEVTGATKRAIWWAEPNWSGIPPLYAAQPKGKGESNANVPKIKHRRAVRG